ncbi:MAG: CPCC family cysteine-rich protein [Bacteroidota bacterium]
MEIKKKKNKYNKYQCPCCKYYTLEEGRENSFDICDVCYWEDDEIQEDDPSYTGGANDVSLNQARENFKKYKAASEFVARFTRAPNEYELPD